MAQEIAMYLQHFGLTQAPFSATPNTQFLLELNNSGRMFKELILALNKPDGFVNVTGAAGVGKTTVRHKLLKALRSHSARYEVIDIPYPRMEEKGFFSAIAQELHVPHDSWPGLKDTVLDKLRSLARSGKRNILVIDEGQTMPDSTLNALLDLSQLEPGSQALMQVAIFAQAEFSETLNSHRQKLLRERLRASHVLLPVNANDIPQYIAKRLQLSGYQGAQLFSNSGLQLLCHASQGIPRIINLLAHKAMMEACAEGATFIDDTHISRAIADTPSALQVAAAAKPGWLRRFRG